MNRKNAFLLLSLIPSLFSCLGSWSFQPLNGNVSLLRAERFPPLNLDKGFIIKTEDKSSYITRMVRTAEWKEGEPGMSDQDRGELKIAVTYDFENKKLKNTRGYLSGSYKSGDTMYPITSHFEEPGEIKGKKPIKIRIQSPGGALYQVIAHVNGLALGIGEKQVGTLSVSMKWPTAKATKTIQTEFETIQLYHETTFVSNPKSLQKDCELIPRQFRYSYQTVEKSGIFSLAERRNLMQKESEPQGVFTGTLKCSEGNFNLREQLTAKKSDQKWTLELREPDLSPAGEKMPLYLFGMQDRTRDPHPGRDIRKDDSFTIILRKNFLKYLPEFGNDHEIVLLFSFCEVGTGETVHKIIGPTSLQAENSNFSKQDIIIYGPKTLTGDSVRVSMNVIEFDDGDKEKRRAFLHLAQQVAGPVALADPISAAEIKVATEAAKLLNELDDNDFILQYEFELVSGQDLPHQRALTLREGDYALVKQEEPPLFAQSFALTQKIWKNRDGNWVVDGLCLLGAGVLDILALPLVAGRNLLLDTPDSISRAEIGGIKGKDSYFAEKVGENHHRPLLFEPATSTMYLGDTKENPDPTKENDPDRTSLGEKYTSKTWLTFSIEKGRDPSLWEYRKKLTEAEEKILKSLRGVDYWKVISESQLIQAMNELASARKQAADERKKNQENMLKQLLGIEDYDSLFKKEQQGTEDR